MSSEDDDFGTLVDAMPPSINAEKGVQHEKPVGKETPATVTPTNIPYKLDSYKTHRPSMGQVHIFSYFNYSENKEHDVKAIRNTFPQLGFDEPIEYKDYTKNKTIAKIKEIAASDFSAHNAVVLVFITQENKGKLCAVDDEYEVENIWDPFLESDSSLVGKPKIFIIQASRGDKSDEGTTGVDESSIDVIKDELRIPSFADMLIVYSTPQGYKSYSESEGGSWLIKHLCSCINHFKGQLDRFDFESILVMVKHHIAYNLTSQDDDKKQIPFISSTLTKHLYFGRPSENSRGTLTDTSNVAQKSKTSFQLSGVLPNVDDIDGDENIASSGNRQRRNASVAQNLKKPTNVTIELDNGTKIHVSQ